MRSYIAGLTLSTAGGSPLFGVAAGAAADNSDTDTMSLSSAYTKSTSPWAVGSGNGSLDTGPVGNNSWYHVHLIKRTDTNVVDLLLSLSATSPTLPANYTLSRRIGAMKTNGAGQWMKFDQFGDAFTWDVSPGLDVSLVNPGTAASTITLNAVPTGVPVRASINARLVDGTPLGVSLSLSSLAISDSSPTKDAATLSTFLSGNSGGLQASAMAVVRTNINGQIRARVDTSDPNVRIFLNVNGWDDARGRLN